MGGLLSWTAAAEGLPGVDEPQEQTRTWPERIREGKPGAFHSLFLRHSGELLGFVHCLLGNTGRAERVVQDAFLELYRSRGRAGSDVSARRELYRLVTVRVLDELCHGGADEAPNRPGDPRILQALRRLPFPQRLALLLNRLPSVEAHDLADWLGMERDDFQRLVLDASQRLAAELHDSCAAKREAC
jgi:DNA-directed RNA polymerase specialized sigma24 family protein